MCERYGYGVTGAAVRDSGIVSK